MDKKEYIGRGELMEKIMKIRENSPYIDTESDLIHRIEHNNFISMVVHHPAADVVEVVRCKDCAYWDCHGTTGRCESPRNGLIYEYTDGDDYCSYGEKEDA